MEEVFVYCDNSNIFIEAQRIAEERNEHVDARYRVRINFDNMLRLAHADRPMRKAITAGSVPPELRQLWNRMEHQGVRVELFNRIRADLGEQEIPDQRLQLEMMKDALIWADDPGIVVLLTGNGAGYLEGVGFQSALELMRQRGWRVEVLSWAHSCNFRMREWVEQNGVFVPLDDFYDSITFLEPSTPGHRLAESRDSVTLDLSARATA
jgi:hypothetical protein